MRLNESRSSRCPPAARRRRSNRDACASLLNLILWHRGRICVTSEVCRRDSLILVDCSCCGRLAAGGAAMSDQQQAHSFSRPLPPPAPCRSRPQPAAASHGPHSGSAASHRSSALLDSCRSTRTATVGRSIPPAGDHGRSAAASRGCPAQQSAGRSRSRGRPCSRARSRSQQPHTRSRRCAHTFSTLDGGGRRGRPSAGRSAWAARARAAGQPQPAAARRRDSQRSGPPGRRPRCCCLCTVARPARCSR